MNVLCGTEAMDKQEQGQKSRVGTGSHEERSAWGRGTQVGSSLGKLLLSWAKRYEWEGEGKPQPRWRPPHFLWLTQPWAALLPSVTFCLLCFLCPGPCSTVISSRPMLPWVLLIFPYQPRG